MAKKQNMNTLLALAAGVVAGRYLRTQMESKDKDAYIAAALPGSMLVPGKTAGALVAGIGCAGLSSFADAEILPMLAKKNGGNGNGNGNANGA